MKQTCSFYLIAFFGLFLFSEIQKTNAQEVKKIELVHANSLEYDENIGNNARRLLGNVAFKHEGVYLYCDSAYLYQDNNSLDAYNNVHIKQGDTLNLYGDSLKYNGNTKVARLRGNIKVIRENMTLTTNYLDYKMKEDIAYYTGSGKIVNKEENNTLTSDIGYFYTKQNAFFFKDNVRLDNPDYKIRADTLKYNSETEVTYFLGPTDILTGDDKIYCERGWYDTKTKKAVFQQNALIDTKDQQLSGDSIFYDQNAGTGEAFYNVSVIDTTQDFIIYGDYAIYHEKDSTSLVTGEKTMLIQLFDKDSLFLHADTLFATYDSTGKHRMMHAYHQVKFYKKDIQGKCDSLIFSDADSTITLYTAPILWSDENQMTADSVSIRQYDGEIKSLYMDRNAFIISREDSGKFNQIKGKDMIGHFKKGELRKVDVFGNGQTIYYAKENDSTLIGINKTVCSNMVIYIKDNEVKKLTFLTNPSATLYPLDKIKESDLKLDGFIWKANMRPLSKEAIFTWEKETEETEETEKIE